MDHKPVKNLKPVVVNLNKFLYECAINSLDFFEAA